MSVPYPEPMPLPVDGVNLVTNPGAEVDASGVEDFYEFIPPSTWVEGDSIPPEPDESSLVVVRSTTQHHEGVASFQVQKNAQIDRLYTIGADFWMQGLTIGLGCIVDYYLYLPTGSGSDGAGRLGLQPMPQIIDPVLPGPENIDQTDQRRVSLTTRSVPPTAENTWIHQQVTFYPTSEELLFRLVITYNDVYTGPESFYLDQITVVHDPSLGYEDGTGGGDGDDDDDVPDIDIRPPVPTVLCSLDPRSDVVPIVLVAGYNLFSDARAYAWISTHRADGSLRPSSDTLNNFEHEYTNYDDILAGYTQVLNVVRTDGHGVTEQIQYAYPVPIQDGEFGIMDIDAPMDTWYQYQVTIKTNVTPTSQVIMTTEKCYINSSLFAPEYAGCSPALLSDPLVPSYAQWFGLTSIDPLSWPGRRELFEIISRHFPVAQADIRLMARTTIRGITKTLIERAKILEIMHTGRILRLRIPDPQYPEANWYISVGALEENRVFPDHRRPERRWEMEVAVVERPVGTVNQWDYTRTYTTLRDFESDGVTPVNPQTYQHVKEAYTDYLAVIYGKTYSADNAGLPPGLTYGEGRWPSVQAVESSVNWLPELPVP